MEDSQRVIESNGSLDMVAGGSLDSNTVLVQRILQRDANAFTALVDRYQEFVFRICFGILRHRQDAEDATQDTFSRLVKYLDRWDPRRPLEPWLATVAGNRSRSQLARRRPHAPLTSAAEPQSLATSQAHDADAMREEIGLALQQLPPRQQVAFRLFHEQSLSYDEIARHMDCPVGTVKTLVHRARRGLIERLQERDVVARRRSDAARCSPGGAR
jgi:RNA polymerase sigma-70 factor (ECF subfamily)